MQNAMTYHAASNGSNHGNGDRPADLELLRRYAEARDEAAFGELVHRHVDFVYSAALRRLGGDAHSAADVAQQVFTALARRAAALARGAVLPGWLFAFHDTVTVTPERCGRSRGPARRRGGGARPRFAFNGRLDKKR
jgi:hypothetical protein